MMPSLWVLAPPSKARTRYYSERSAWCWQRVTVLSSVPWALQWREDFSVKEDHQFISNERNLGQRACPRRAFDMKLVWSQEASGYWHLKPSVFLLWASFPKWRNWTHESKFSSHFHSLWAHLWKADDEKAKSVQGQRNFQGPGFTGHIFPFLTSLPDLQTVQPAAETSNYPLHILDPFHSFEPGNHSAHLGPLGISSYVKTAFGKWGGGI